MTKREVGMTMQIPRLTARRDPDKVKAFLIPEEEVRDMGLPGHRRTSSHKRRRAAHFALKKLNLVSCPKCKEPSMPHRACPNCGTYAGRKVVDLASPLAKSTKEKKTKEPAK